MGHHGASARECLQSLRQNYRFSGYIFFKKIFLLISALICMSETGLNSALTEHVGINNSFYLLYAKEIEETVNCKLGIILLCHCSYGERNF